MSFVLPELPYDKNAFGSFMSEEAFQYHHGKHHATYITNLNKNIEGTKYAGLALTDIVVKSFEDKALPVFNNAAQHYNHSFFWDVISPNGGGHPSGKLAELIDSSFGNFGEFRAKFSTTATTVFGSGWAWLALNAEGALEVLPYGGAGCPLLDGKKPLLTIDVWEHAYYIDHRNQRPAFIEKFWEVVNWKHVEGLL